MTRYFVDLETAGQKDVQRVFAALLDLRADHLVSAQIDVIPCHPPVAEEAPSVITIHDCGWIVDFEADPDLAAQVAARAEIPREPIGELP